MIVRPTQLPYFFDARVMKRFAHERWIENEEAKLAHAVGYARGGLKNLIFSFCTFWSKEGF